VIGLDTNVIVRYLVQDDPDQSGRANELVEGLTASDRGFISLVALVEVSWVLGRAYGLDREGVADIVASLLGSAELVLERAGLVESALEDVSEGADFADAVIARSGVAAGCQQTVTFDARAAKRAGMTLIGPSAATAP